MQKDMKEIEIESNIICVQSRWQKMIMFILDVIVLPNLTFFYDKMTLFVIYKTDKESCLLFLFSSRVIRCDKDDEEHDEVGPLTRSSSAYFSFRAEQKKK